MSEQDVQKLFIQAFDLPRESRSEEYKMGVIAALRFRLNRACILCPFAAGSAAFDAFHAGIDEGHAIWRKNESG